MKNSLKKNLPQAAFIAFFVILTLTVWFLPRKTYSDSERRELASFPKITAQSLLDGTFMSRFETYSADQFPLRDTFRRVKAFFSYKVLGKLDNNDIYVAEGYAAKQEYPLNEASIAHATDRFTYIYEKYLKDNGNTVYASVIPDKSCYLAEKSGYLSMDYAEFFRLVEEGMPYAEYIDISGTLSVDSYYKTDTHWRQEKITETANVLLTGMGGEASSLPMEEKTLDHPFYGVYYGQAALPMPSETIKYLTSSALDSCVVTNMEKNQSMSMYDMDRAAGKDPYEMFLGGPISLITIENPNAATDKELIVFRDSFGSAIAPLLAEGYRKVTLIDIRYLMPDFLGNFVDFENSDVLFLYSTLVLNNSETIK